MNSLMTLAQCGPPISTHHRHITFSPFVLAMSNYLRFAATGMSGMNKGYAGG